MVLIGKQVPSNFSLKKKIFLSLLFYEAVQTTSCFLCKLMRCVFVHLRKIPHPCSAEKFLQLKKQNSKIDSHRQVQEYNSECYKLLKYMGQGKERTMWGT